MKYAPVAAAAQQLKIKKVFKVRVCKMSRHHVDLQQLDLAAQEMLKNPINAKDRLYNERKERRDSHQQVYLSQKQQQQQPKLMQQQNTECLRNKN